MHARSKIECKRDTRGDKQLSALPPAEGWPKDLLPPGKEDLGRASWTALHAMAGSDRLAEAAADGRGLAAVRRVQTAIATFLETYACAECHENIMQHRADLHQQQRQPAVRLSTTWSLRFWITGPAADQAIRTQAHLNDWLYAFHQLVNTRVWGPHHGLTRSEARCKWEPAAASAVTPADAASSDTPAAVASSATSDAPLYITAKEPPTSLGP